MTEENLTLLETLLKEQDEALNITPTPAQEVEEQNWVLSSLPPLEPLTIEDWWFDRSGENAQAPAGKTAIILPAGAAFGSGEHATTVGCLTLYKDLTAQGWRPESILDFGAGSGILAMAAAKRDGLKALGVDIDPVSVQTAARNAEDNALTNLLEFTQGDTPPPGQNFQLVFANILANPLIALAEPLAKSVAQGGFIILSGFLENQAAGVHAAYESQGLVLHKRFQKGEWCATAFTRP